MTKDRILTILRAWHNAMRECDERMDQLTAVAGQVVESPLGDAVYRIAKGRAAFRASRLSAGLERKRLRKL